MKYAIHTEGYVLDIAADTTYKIYEVDGTIPKAKAGTNGLTLCAQRMYAETPEKSYANILGDMLGMEVLNSGVGGLKMEPEFVRSVCDDSADMTLLAFGVNDASLQKEPQQFEADSVNVFSLLADQCRGKLYVVTPLVWPGEEAGSKYPLTLYREIIRTSAKQFPKITVIEGEELLSNAPENFFDSVHPNSNGMKQLAGALAGMLGKKNLAYE